MSFPIKEAVIGYDTSFRITENYTQNYISAAPKRTHLSVNIVKLVCEKMNLAITWLPPFLEFNRNFFVKQFGDLDEGLSDVSTGFVPWSPIVITSSFDATISYEYISVQMLVPCLKAIPGTEKLLTTFLLSVWLTTGLVLPLTTAVFWCASNVPYRSVCNKTHTYQSLPNCFQTAWAVFVAVSVPQQSKTCRISVFFFLYFCLCLTISTVFQAFFVSYLVEPTYEKKIETYDEILNSDLVYGYTTALKISKTNLVSRIY